MCGLEDIGLVAAATDEDFGLALARRRGPDLVLLDATLARLSGAELAARLAQDEAGPAIVVLVTVREGFALDGFEPTTLRAADFRQAAEPPAEPKPDEPESHDTGPYETGLWVPGRRGIVRLDLQSVIWFAADRDYVRINTESGERLIRLSMNSLVERLDPAKFLRVHRSAIVNRDRVEGIERCAKGTLKIVLSDGAKVAVARSYVRTVRAALFPARRPRRIDRAEQAARATA